MARTMVCPVCGDMKETWNATCTASACQEASYYANAARNARKGSKKRADLEQRAFAAAQRATPFMSFAKAVRL